MPKRNPARRKPEAPMTILDTAKSLIYGDREAAYGHPSINLTNIARFWTVLVNATHDTALEFDAGDVAKMMALVKLARMIPDDYHHDSAVDLAGYIGLLERLNETPTNG